MPGVDPVPESLRDPNPPAAPLSALRQLLPRSLQLLGVTCLAAAPQPPTVTLDVEPVNAMIASSI